MQIHVYTIKIIFSIKKKRFLKMFLVRRIDMQTAYAGIRNLRVRETLFLILG